MKKNFFVMAAVIAAMFVSLSCFAQTGKVNNFRIKRGTNVSHWLSQSEQRGEARRLHIQEDDFARPEELGFDLYASPSTRCSSGMRRATNSLRLGSC